MSVRLIRQACRESSHGPEKSRYRESAIETNTC